MEPIHDDSPIKQHNVPRMTVPLFNSIENIKRLHSKNGEVPIELIRDFLVESVPEDASNSRQANSSSSQRDKSPVTKDIALQKGGKLLEGVIQKQTFLADNNLFDPSKYFGGLEVPDLDEPIPDERLTDMFLEYLPTEMEEEAEAAENLKKQAMKKKPQETTAVSKTVNLADKENCPDQINGTKSQKNRTSKSPVNVNEKSKQMIKGHASPMSYAAELFKKKPMTQNTTATTSQNVATSKPLTPKTYSFKRLNTNLNSKDLKEKSNAETPVNTSVKRSQELSSCIRSLLYPEPAVTKVKRNSKPDLTKTKSGHQSVNQTKVLSPCEEIEQVPEEKTPQNQIGVEKPATKPKTATIKSPTVSKVASIQPLRDIRKASKPGPVSKNHPLSQSIEKQASSRARNRFNIKNFASFAHDDTQSTTAATSQQFNLSKGEWNETVSKTRSANPSFVEDPANSILKGLLSPKRSKASEEKARESARYAASIQDMLEQNRDKLTDDSHMITLEAEPSTPEAKPSKPTQRFRSQSVSKISRKTSHNELRNSDLHRNNDQPSMSSNSNQKNVSLTPDPFSDRTMRNRSASFSTRPSSASVAYKAAKRNIRVTLNNKSELLVYPADQDLTGKATLLSDRAERHMMHQMYIRKLEDKAPAHYRMTHKMSEPFYDSMTKEEQEYQKMRYEKFKVKFDRMVFDKDKNLIHLKSSKLVYDKNALADRKTNQSTKSLLKKIAEKSNALKPESLLEMTKEEKPHHLKSNKIGYDQFREQKIDLLGTKLRGLRNEAIIEKANNEIAEIKFKTGYAIDKLEDQNFKVLEANNELVKQTDDLKAENGLLQRKAQILQQELFEAHQKNEELNNRVQELEFLLPLYNILQKKYQDATVAGIVNKIERLEGYCQEYLAQVMVLEDKLRVMRGEVRTAQATLNEKEHALQNEQNARHEIFKDYRDEITGLKGQAKNIQDHQKDYLELSNKVFNLYSKWVEKLDIFTNIQKEPTLNAKPQNPIEMIDLIDKLIPISSTDAMQKYIKRIIVSANQLLRKYLPDALELKYDPDKVYEMVSKHIHGLEVEIKKLKKLTGAGGGQESSKTKK